MATPMVNATSMMGGEILLFQHLFEATIDSLRQIVELK
ncbi:MAG: hypothetical protein AVDCRST_MAG96-4263 [uncultured Segetibacter sp.]|uniref:Uncharacterized protein n=1 Tax=uncultured Segetibacter sp. TaxID=481133 RepID=A0A6J4U781_9BACT|nr:MAG: hypothetical protein AVDCRST_MAG96-4263 [uncultured Segetibacter sp.]